MVLLSAPVPCHLQAFMTYSLLGYQLTADVAFPALSLFNLLRFPVMMFPAQIMNLINGKVALDRIQNFIEVSLDQGYRWLVEHGGTAQTPDTSAPDISMHRFL